MEGYKEFRAPRSVYLKTERVLEYIHENLNVHKAEYLDQKAVQKYQAVMSTVSGTESCDTGVRRTIRTAFMEQYGLTQLEAVNVLNGCHVEECLERYQERRIHDEMKVFLLAVLQSMRLPQELNTKQIDILEKIFVEDKVHPALNELWQSEDKRKHAEMLLKKLLLDKS